jgi:hypothetical protein
VAIGQYSDPTGAFHGLIEMLSGTTWTNIDAPLPANGAPGNYSVLTALACSAVGSCVAIGYYLDASGNSASLIETLSGGTWTATDAPFPANAYSTPNVNLDAVACAAVGSCVVVGIYADTNNTSQGLIETLSGGTWTATEAPLPANADSTPYPNFVSVTCPAIDSCVAIGIYSRPGYNQEGLIERLSGGTWTATQAPVPANAEVGHYTALNAVACSAIDSCVAIGHYFDMNNNEQGLIETLSGGTWTPSEARVPANAYSTPYTDLNFLACPAVGSCVAIGFYLDTNTNQQSLVETLSGGTWTATEAPLPANASSTPYTELAGMACPAVGSCVAVGSYFDSQIGYVGLFEVESDSTSPTITSVSPSSGPITGGTSVTILGTNLSSPTSVTFGGNAGTVTGYSDTSITVTTPAGTPGAPAIVDVVVTTAGGSATDTGGYIYGVPPAITSASSTTFIEGTSGTFTVIATGTPDPTIAETGPLPAGVTFSSGILSGIPTEDGTYVISFTAHNGVGADATQSFTLTVNSAPAITSAASATFTKGAIHTFTVTATGTPAPTVTETGTLPSGVTFTAGVLSGNPTVSGVFHITFTAHNGVGSDAIQSFTLTVPGLYVSPTTLPNGKRGVAYKVTLHAAGGPVPYTWKILTALPKGLVLSVQGVLSGKPATTLAAKTYSFKVQVTDATKPMHKTATATMTLILK